MQRISYDTNVVQFYGACMSGEGAWLCMEYMEVGCLRMTLTLTQTLALTLASTRRRDSHVAARYYSIAVSCSRELQHPCLPGSAVAFHIGSRMPVPAHSLCSQRPLAEGTSHTASTLQSSASRCCLTAQHCGGRALHDAA